MIIDSLDLSADAFEAATGWAIKPQGACKAEMCVPLGRASGFDLTTAAERLGMALVPDAAAGLWALGPESVGGRALVSATLPDITLKDLAANDFALSSLRGQKVVLVAWAPY